jgi:hypothetical protein
MRWTTRLSKRRMIGIGLVIAATVAFSSFIYAYVWVEHFRFPPTRQGEVYERSTSPDGRWIVLNHYLSEVARRSFRLSTELVQNLGLCSTFSHRASPYGFHLES